MSEVFVTPAWLAEHLDQPDVVAVEASFYLPDDGKDATALFEAGHIPGAVRFDIEAVADTSSSLPHMLPDATTFGAMVGSLGLSETTTIVIYDASDLLGGARAYWMFQHFGAKHVRLLDGGLRAWIAAGHRLETGRSRRAPQSFAATFDRAGAADARQVLNAVRSGSAQIVDARSAPRFAGEIAEPRPGLRAGHIPGSRNLPWRALVDQDGRLYPADQLAARFSEAGVDLDRPIITSCGSGVSAAIIALAMDRLGKPDSVLYDGSWADWGGRNDLPIETGPPRRI